jgi:hypothetical protein
MLRLLYYYVRFGLFRTRRFESIIKRFSGGGRTNLNEWNRKTNLNELAALKSHGHKQGVENYECEKGQELLLLSVAKLNSKFEIGL